MGAIAFAPHPLNDVRVSCFVTLVSTHDNCQLPSAFFFVHVHEHACVHICNSMYVRMHVCRDVPSCTCLYVCSFKYICLNVCVCTCVHIHTCLHACMSFMLQ